MRQKTITTDKATLLVVELPLGVKNIRIDTNQSVIPYGKEVNYEVPATKESYGYEETEGFSLPYGNWQLIGRMSDIAEKQADQVVDEYTYNTGEIEGYYDYDNDTQTDCPIESLNSLMYTNEVYFENHLGDEPIMTDEYYNDGGEEKWELEISEWREAQSEVWDKERTYIFIKVD